MLYRNLSEFFEAIPKYKRIMCLDFGEKKVGIAFSDTTHLIANSHSLYKMRSTSKDIGAINRIFLENQAGSMIIGLPLDLKSQENELCAKVVAFANKLIKKHNVDIYLHDERFTTAVAVSMLKTFKFSLKKSQNIEDKVAACLILQQALDMRKNI